MITIYKVALCEEIELHTFICNLCTELYRRERKQDMLTLIKQANNTIIRSQFGRIKVN